MSVVGRRGRPKIPSLAWRAPPPNPRYADVTPTVDSGTNTARRRRRNDRLGEADRCCKVRADEIFRRVGLTHLVALILEQAKLEMQVGQSLHGRLRVIPRHFKISTCVCIGKRLSYYPILFANSDNK